MTVVWVERLTLPDLARLWLEAALTGAEVRYDEHKATAAAARALVWLAPRRFFAAGLTLGLKDARGRALTYQVHAELDEATRVLRQNFPEKRAASALASYVATPLLPRVNFLVMARAAAAARPADRHVFHVVRHPFNALLRGALRQSWSARGALRTAAAPVLTWCSALLRAALPRRAPTDLEAIGPSVWMQYLEVHAIGFGSCAFWHPHVNVPGVDKVFVLDTPGIVWDEPAQARVKAMGFRWVDCRKPLAAARLSLSALLTLAALPFSSPANSPWWLGFFTFELELWTSLWEDIYRHFQVKLLWQGQEYWWRQNAQARGLERAGGAMFGLHWSEFMFQTEPIHATPQHAYFVWGRTNLGWLRGKGYDGGEVLPCGVWLTPRKTPDPFAGLAPGGRLKLAFYDSGYLYDLFQTPESMARFLDFALGLLERHPDWRAAVKPKSTADYSRIPGGPALMERLRALERGGKLAVLHWNTSPSAVGPRADLSVCYGFNSAGIVSAAFGGRSVMWDCSGWRDHPLYREPSQKILYEDLGALEAALEAAAGGDASVGDYGRWRALTNHFGDDQAPKRVAGWINDYLTLVLSGRLALEAVRDASARYRREQGVDAAFYQGEAWWSDIITAPR